MSNRIGLALAASLVVPTVFAVSVAAPAQAHRPRIDEGGDRSHCVTEREFGLLAAGETPSDSVHRIFDTNGRRVGKRTLANTVADSLPKGLHPDTAPPQFRQVRKYATCQEGFVLVEFNKHTRRVVSAYYEATTGYTRWR